MALPAGYTLRTIQREDYDRGILKVQESLTKVGKISKAEFYERFDLMYMKHADIFNTLVIEHDEKVIACGTVVIEPKFLFERGMVGHIEDIAVLDVERGKGFGRFMIASLDDLGKKLGTYKNSLSCSEKNKPFYEKCNSHELNHYFNDEAAELHV